MRESPYDSMRVELGLHKEFAKALNKEAEASKYISNMFPRLSRAKTEGGIVTRPDIHNMIQLQEYEEENKNTSKERNVWMVFRQEVEIFFLEITNVGIVNS